MSAKNWAWVAAALALLAGSPASIAASEFNLFVDKSQRRLIVKQGETIAKQYSIALGRGGRGDKTQTGDLKTPIGTYRIVKFKADSDFHFFMQLNYPNVKDAFYGLKNGVIDRATFDRIIASLNNGSMPPQDTPLGGFIGIHGIGEVDDKRLKTHRVANWTEGCIAVTNEEIIDLRRYVGIGTKVTIQE
jgi:murein L,D-transpeptidase YafK